MCHIAPDTVAERRGEPNLKVKSVMGLAPPVPRANGTMFTGAFFVLYIKCEGGPEIQCFLEGNFMWTLLFC